MKHRLTISNSGCMLKTVFRIYKRCWFFWWEIDGREMYSCFVPKYVSKMQNKYISLIVKDLRK